MVYSELQTEIAETLNRRNLTARIPRFIEFAEAEFNRELRVREGQLSKFTTLYADDYRVQLPAGWMAFEEIAADGCDWPVEYMPPEPMRDDRRMRAKGAPRHYTVVGDEIQFSPVSDADRQVTITYYSRLKLTDGEPSNWLLTNHPDIYIYGALVLSAPLLYQDERVPMWQSLYLPKLDSLKTQDRIAKAGSQSKPLRMRSRNLG
jgi:hypothetical protein